jgi:hypothetical protein
MPADHQPKKALYKRSGVELLVIVVGVLIALWADQWWSDREDDRTEQTYLASLKEDINATLQELDSTIAKVVVWRQAASTLSQLPLEGPVPPNEELAEMMGLALFELFSFEDRLSTHQDLKSTGRLGLISNRDIRRSLAELDSLLENIVSIETDLMQTHHMTIDPYMVRHTDLATLARVGYVSNITNPAIRAKYQDADKLLGASLGVDHTSIINELEFRNILVFRIVLLSEALLTYNTLRDALVQLQQQINQELAG